MSRRYSREEAFKVLFEISFHGADNLDKIIEYYYGNFDTEQLEKVYFENVVRGVNLNIDEIEDIVSRFSISWKKSRISRVSLAVLRLCIYEVLHMDDIPNSVSVNEAVELAKVYEGPEAGSFVNGILGSFIRSTEPTS